MLELVRFLDSLTQSVAVFDMAAVVAYSRVKDVIERVFPQKQVAQQSNALRIFIVHPHASQVRYRVYHLFLFLQFLDEILVVHVVFPRNILDFILVFFNKGNDGFSVVFGNVLRLVFESLLNQQLLSSHFICFYDLLLDLLVRTGRTLQRHIGLRTWRGLIFVFGKTMDVVPDHPRIFMFMNMIMIFLLLHNLSQQRFVIEILMIIEGIKRYLNFVIMGLDKVIEKARAVMVVVAYLHADVAYIGK